MRLSSLKLSGFKSFADSTTLQFKANRSAIVGPNGCGKSNVIDAIRWVMGESSARQLRGGSMQDVIFTGTAKRKPVGVASVELRFENTYGKLGGMYNAYNELAVRRQVTREGKSEYFLNGTRCRRRDITDIFLGTGLGPRSYAIIEQGMINRLVDAKPEEMRVFVEEAAGVSRYQARRRETLQHLEHTTQNLERLEDIAHELKAQLKTLKRQSEAAVQYKQLEQQVRTLKIEILSFQCQQSQRLQQEYTAQMTEFGEQFKLVRSELNTVEHDLTETSGLFQRLIQQSTPLQQAWQTAEKNCLSCNSMLSKNKLYSSKTVNKFHSLSSKSRS
jgi:chromosome segregation protein